jgi:outer membrane receptor protein involved in Fe transport
LLVDRPAALALDVNLSARQSRFSAFGSTTTYQGGVRWSPAKALTVRGSYAQVFRAPTTLNLYATQSLEIEVVGDPCGMNPSAAQKIHCAADGVPGGSYRQDDVRPLVQIVLGGNPALQPERGETWTAGFAFQLPGKESSAALDYYHSRLSNAIGTSEPQLIADECANTGASGACASTSRTPDGTLDRIDMRYSNLSRLATDGVDLSSRMSRGLGRFGTLSAKLSATYIVNFERTSFIGGAAAALAGTTDGIVSWPRWRAQASADWDRNSWSASYGARYIGHTRECGDTNEFLSPDDCRVVGDRVYQSIAVSRHWSSGITTSAYVNNIANVPPPRINRSGNANTDAAIYDVLGRVYSLRLTYSVR